MEKDQGVARCQKGCELEKERLFGIRLDHHWPHPPQKVRVPVLMELAVKSTVSADQRLDGDASKGPALRKFGLNGAL